MDIVCFDCHKPVCKNLPEDTIFRGVAQCPECISKQIEIEDEVEASRCMIDKLQQEFNEMEFYKNIKTGEIYHLAGIATDATNSNEGAMYVAYNPVEAPDVLYIREYDEFHRKFKKTDHQPA